MRKGEKKTHTHTHRHRETHTHAHTYTYICRCLGVCVLCAFKDQMKSSGQICQFNYLSFMIWQGITPLSIINFEKSSIDLMDNSCNMGVNESNSHTVK